MRALDGRSARRRRIRSKPSTRASRSTLIVGSSAGGGYDTYARLLARHLGDAHPRQSVDRGAEHERRGQQPRGRLHLFGGAEGRHRHRRDLSRRDSAAAARRRRRSSTIRASSSTSAAPTATSTSASCAPTRRSRHSRMSSRQELIVGASNEGATTRDLPALVEQRARHQVPHRHGLRRQPRNHARARTRRGAGRLRHRLDRHRDDAPRLVLERHDQGPGAAQPQGPSRSDPDGRAARRRVRQERRTIAR